MIPFLKKENGLIVAWNLDFGSRSFKRKVEVMLAPPQNGILGVNISVSLALLIC